MFTKVNTLRDIGRAVPKKGQCICSKMIACKNNGKYNPILKRSKDNCIIPSLLHILHFFLWILSLLHHLIVPVIVVLQRIWICKFVPRYIWICKFVPRYIWICKFVPR